MTGLKMILKNDRLAKYPQYLSYVMHLRIILRIKLHTSLCSYTFEIYRTLVATQ